MASTLTGESIDTDCQLLGKRSLSVGTVRKRKRLRAPVEPSRKTKKEKKKVRLEIKHRLSENRNLAESRELGYEKQCKVIN